MSLRFIIFIFVCSIVCLCAKPKSKGSSAVALPRGKNVKKKSNGGSGGFFGQVINRVFRETKTLFCSGMEAMTLQLTKPVDSALAKESLEELVHALNTEYENPNFVIGLLAKFSRKMNERNVFTKFKSLLCVHKLIQSSSDAAKTAITSAFGSLRSAHDGKCGNDFFALEYLDEIENTASNMGAGLVSGLCRDYAIYVFEFVEVRGDKAQIKEGMYYITLTIN